MDNIRIAPGETIKEVLEMRGLRPFDLAIKLDMTIKQLDNLLHGSSVIDEALAESLEAVFDIDKSFWIGLDRIYREGE